MTTEKRSKYTKTTDAAIKRITQALSTIASDYGTTVREKYEIFTLLTKYAAGARLELGLPEEAEPK